MVASTEAGPCAKATSPSCPLRAAWEPQDQQTVHWEGSPVVPRSLQRHREPCPHPWHRHRRDIARSGRGQGHHRDTEVTGRAAPELWEAADPGMSRQPALLCPAVARPVPVGSWGGQWAPSPGQGSAVGMAGCSGRSRGQQQLCLGLSLGVSLMESVK